MATAKQSRRIDPMDVLMGRRADRDSPVEVETEAPADAPSNRVVITQREGSRPKADELVTTTITIPAAIRQKMKLKAFVEGTTMGELLRDLLSQADEQGYFDVRK